MKYISNETWEKLPCVDFRPRFFVESYQEKLSVYTPHFFQARLMDVFSCCTEILAYIEEYKTNNKNKGYILSSLDEIESCFDNDPIASSFFEASKALRSKLFNSIRSKDFSSTSLNRLGVMCRAILSQEGSYTEQLRLSLKESITNNTNLSHKDRITNNIYCLTGLYITRLLNKGFSPTYLYNRIEMFVRPNNYAANDNFQDQFEFVTEKLGNYTTNYQVFFALHANKPNIFIANGGELYFQAFSNIGIINDKNLEKLRKEFEPNLIVKTKIEATDYISAIWQIKDKIDKFLDSVTALELNPTIKVSSNCVAVWNNQGSTHEKTLNINLLLGFLTSESGTYFSNSNTSTLHTLTKLNQNGKDHLGRSLRYLRLARESISLEQKLLNLWIALESLFADGEKNILDNIIEYVPQIYAISGLLRRVHNIRDLLVKNQIQAPKNIQSSVLNNSQSFTLETTDSQIFQILRNESLALELFDSLSTKEHLKFKLSSTFKEIKDNKLICQRLKNSENDISRQLRRIYFLRNKIAHTGHYSNIRPQLVTHLLDYIAACYMAISISANQAKNEGGYSINDLFSAYKLGSEIIEDRLKLPQPITQLNEITPVPFI